MVRELWKTRQYPCRSVNFDRRFTEIPIRLRFILLIPFRMNRNIERKYGRFTNNNGGWLNGNFHSIEYMTMRWTFTCYILFQKNLRKKTVKMTKQKLEKNFNTISKTKKPSFSFNEYTYVLYIFHEHFVWFQLRIWTMRSVNCA